MQEKNAELDSALKQARKQARSAKANEDKMTERVADLEAKLAAANDSLAEFHSDIERNQSQLVLQLKALLAKNENDAEVDQVDTVKAQLSQLIEQICQSTVSTTSSLELC